MGTYRNSTSTRMVNRYVLSGHLKDGDMVKNVHFFEVVGGSYDCSLVTEAYLKEKEEMLLKRATLVAVSRRRIIPTYKVAQSFDCNAGTVVSKNCCSYGSSIPHSGHVSRSTRRWCCQSSTVVDLSGPNGMKVVLLNMVATIQKNAAPRFLLKSRFSAIFRYPEAVVPPSLFNIVHWKVESGSRSKQSRD